VVNYGGILSSVECCVWWGWRDCEGEEGGEGRRRNYKAKLLGVLLQWTLLNCGGA
jgi:hypothetical protein